MAERERGTGWLLFASIVMVTAGIMRIIDAFWAFDRDDEYQSINAVVFDNDMTAYGWIWLVVGILLVLSGLAVMGGSELARWFGIGMASLAAITSMLWIYEFPIWSLLNTMIALGVVYALAVYGGESAPMGRSGSRMA